MNVPQWPVGRRAQRHYQVSATKTKTVTVTVVGMLIVTMTGSVGRRRDEARLTGRPGRRAPGPWPARVAAIGTPGDSEKRRPGGRLGIDHRPLMRLDTERALVERG